jgi:hypothetical protein
VGNEPSDPGEDRLLPGESASMSSGDLGDVREWVAVYSELYGFKENLLQEVGAQREKIQEPGKVELDNDRALLEREARRLKRRLDYWERELRRRGRS